MKLPSQHAYRLSLITKFY